MMELNKSKIEQSILSNDFVSKFGSAELVETHASWVVIAKKVVFKIKKPLQFSFLDFSTLNKRKYYCEQEVLLNRRLTKGMYLGVVPISCFNGEIYFENNAGEIIDYAVKMQRMDYGRQMDKLLEERKVKKKDIEKIAEQLAAFHKKAEKIEVPVSPEDLHQDFNDIEIINEFVVTHLGKEAGSIIDLAIASVNYFFKKNSNCFTKRQKMGFVVDGHGDLHSKNIFLLKNKAVIFDCIEFNDHFRRVDVLDEIAFFCMDLDFYEASKFQSFFIEKYNKNNNCFLEEKDWELFNYYKLYRANVRAKVNAINASQIVGEKGFEKQLLIVKKYLKLMEEYLTQSKAVA